MAQQLFYFILFLNNNIIITSNKIMWGITKPKVVPAHLYPGFLRAPCYSDTINRKPEKNLHIL